VVDAVLERLPEVLQQRNPVLFAAGDGVELVFQPGGEVVVDVGREVLGQELVDDPATSVGVKRFLSSSTYSRSCSVEMMDA
jgi:hypothetical protein